MATITATLPVPASGGDILASPIADTDASIISTYNGNNADENNVDYTSADGIVTLQNAQTISAAKTFSASPILQDNINLTFGTGSDATIDYDGTDLVINPAVVGSGDVVLTGGSLEINDSEGVTLGTGKDATIKYDGTDLVINPAVVGSGDVVLNSGSLEFDDSEGVTLGTGKDATIQYDGTDLVISPAAVGSGDVLISGGSLEINDSESVTFGTGKDATISYDGTDLVISPAAVGSGDVVISGGSLEINDSESLTLGTGKDATLSYDGTDLIISPAAVGSGDVVISGGSLEINDSESLTLGTGKDATLSYDGTNVTLNPQAVGSGGFFVSAGNFMVGDNANGESTLGVTINTGAADDQILSLKSSDVGHGMTDITETDTYGYIKKGSAGSGGIWMHGLSEGSYALLLDSSPTTEVTTDTSSSLAAVLIDCRKKDSASVAALGSSANLLAVRNASTTSLLLKGNGVLHLTSTSLVALDEEDDIGLVRTMARTSSNGMGVVLNKWDEMVKSTRQDLIDAEVLSSEGDFWNVQNVFGLLGGSVWQLYSKMMDGFEERDKQINDLQSQVNALTA
jgi:hypothetical protein